MDEEKLIKIAKPFLDKCRAGDWNHALRVVKWVKLLGKDREDIDLLITAAYIHDIGWTGIMTEGKIEFSQMLNYESKANSNSEKMVTTVLQKMNFANKNIETVNRLIKAADKHKSSQNDEEIIVDADSLSKLCADHFKEKYKLGSYKEVINTFEKDFPKMFKTEMGKRLYPDLLIKLKEELLT